MSSKRSKKKGTRNILRKKKHSKVNLFLKGPTFLLRILVIHTVGRTESEVISLFFLFQVSSLTMCTRSIPTGVLWWSDPKRTMDSGTGPQKDLSNNSPLSGVFRRRRGEESVRTGHGVRVSGSQKKRTSRKTPPGSRTSLGEPGQLERSSRRRKGLLSRWGSTNFRVNPGGLPTDFDGVWSFGHSTNEPTQGGRKRTESLRLTLNGEVQGRVILRPDSWTGPGERSPGRQGW